MKTSISVGTTALLLASLLLSGCGSGYLHQPVAPESVSDSDRFDGSWAGPLKSRYRLRPLTSTRSLYNAIICEPYQDRIKLEVRQGRLFAQLGQAARYRLSTYLDSAGRFYQSMDLGTVGDGDPGNGAQLWIAGEFDPAQGSAKGVVAVTPYDFNQGCQGDFEAQRDGVATSVPSDGRPFSTAYQLTEIRDHK